MVRLIRFDTANWELLGSSINSLATWMGITEQGCGGCGWD